RNDLVTRGPARGELEIAEGHVERVREERQHGFVRPPGLRGRGYTYFPAVAVASDDSRSVRSGSDAQPQARALGSHDPQDIGVPRGAAATGAASAALQ